jgi:hypothetical protein
MAGWLAPVSLRGNYIPHYEKQRCGAASSAFIQRNIIPYRKMKFISY